ncbi:MAG: aminoglycoside 3-N-acetyltransferase [Anaerolineae bacterium]|nr:aminoglycoside 3-N-acetyltransferase [Anaerolineae bacterium]
MVDLSKPIITQQDLITNLRQLGLMPSDTVMVHSSMKAVGNMMGGPNAVMQALLDTLTADGTVMMYVGWENIPDYVGELDAAAQQLFLRHHPPFDPATARATRDHGVLVEVLRTWPGVQRSANPEASIGAVGKQAAWITSDHPLNFGYGAGSPLAKLVETGGKVLMLGAPLDTITLLHHAEALANMPKRTVHYTCPIIRDGQTVWVEIDDYNTGDPHADYEFYEIAEAYLATGRGQTGKVGEAQSYLFDAADLVDFAVRYLEERFGG